MAGVTTAKPPTASEATTLVRVNGWHFTSLLLWSGLAEQLARVLVGELRSVGLADGRVVQELGRLVHVLERVVDREQHVVCAHHLHRAQQRRRAANS
jgi:hypothetical protein